MVHVSGVLILIVTRVHVRYVGNNTPTHQHHCVLHTCVHNLNYVGSSSKYRSARPSLFLSFPPFVWFFLAKVMLEEQPSLAQQ